MSSMLNIKVFERCQRYSTFSGEAQALEAPAGAKWLAWKDVEASGRLLIGELHTVRRIAARVVAGLDAWLHFQVCVRAGVWLRSRFGGSL